LSVSLYGMKMDDVTNAADGLDPKNRVATVRLIDLKVEDDMEKVLNKIQHEFGLIKADLAHIDAKFESKFEHVESRISTGYIVFGIACTVITILLAALGIMIALK